VSGPRAHVRIRARVEGTVQGVGFRPYVHRLASELALAGWVRNDERGVELEVEGPPSAIAAFLERLPAETPPMARLEGVRSESLAPRGQSGFAILASEAAGGADTQVTPDAATCEECLAELRDPLDRRYRYPFINCTNCGPRFTIVRGVPYDRPLTSMAGFAMCDRCRAEYEDPRDRRFHAQPNACFVCGPRAWLLGAAGGAGTEARAGTTGPRAATAGDRHAAPGAAEAPDAIAAAAELLAQGAILAVKGLGGYHLAVRADDEAAVAALRARKHREERPFALMVGDLGAARELAVLEEQACALLGGAPAPIVLAPRRPGAAVAAAVAPASPELGLMLPYTPLHHLLLADARVCGVGALVMTSGNLSDEPIAYRDEDALERLSPIADAFLLHDRPIHVRAEDSVVRIAGRGAGQRPLLLRRSRGLVPGGLALPLACERPVLACGAELKSTFCVARGARAWVSQHIGDLGNWETLRSFREGVAHFERLFAVTPEVIAHDLHPDYLSTAYALEREAAGEGRAIALLGVQHHHAHLAAVLAEHGERGPAVGAIFDGAGHGSDGTAWGGELLVGGLAGFRRAGHLRPVGLPGGDRAAREPWRMACAWIAQATGDPRPPVPAALADRVDPARWEAVAQLAWDGASAPPTTSMGRLFDAVAALCGLRPQVSYEGQAAIELEWICDPGERGAYELRFDGDELDPRPALRGAIADLAAGASPAIVSARFHRGLAAVTARACAEIAAAEGLATVVLAGGVFQNRVLLDAVCADLQRAGLRVLTPRRLPPNDGAISYGQAAIAAAARG
jgi:hydrogenase maturation protein HypF